MVARSKRGSLNDDYLNANQILLSLSWYLAPTPAGVNRYFAQAGGKKGGIKLQGYSRASPAFALTKRFLPAAWGYFAATGSCGQRSKQDHAPGQN